MTEAERVVVAAPAKLTLSLRIVGVRADGYHLIDAEMVTLDLADELEFSAGDGLEVVTSGAAGGLPVPAGDDNLVRRALASVGRRAAVRLVKRIPAGGGLGGGSADAAAVLRWAGCTDLAVAAGAGRRRAVLPGRRPGPGERRRRDDHAAALRAGRRAAVHAAHAALRRDTAAVYRRWDALGGPDADGANDLEAAALAVAPDWPSGGTASATATGQEPALAGSGSTWFVAGAYPGAGRVVGPRRPPPPEPAGSA